MSSTNTQDGQRRLVANKPVEVALNEIVTRARVFTDAGGAAIALRDGDELVTRASSGGIAPDVGHRNRIEGSLTGQAVLKGVPIHIEDSDKDARVDAEICRALNTRSFIITPIAGSTTMLGVLAVFAPTANAFTRTDLAVLRTMADQIATALGGGAFMQQLWPSAKADDAEVASAPAAWQPEEEAPEPEVSFEPPAPEPPRAVEPPRVRPSAPEVRAQQRPAPKPQPPAPLEELLDIPDLAKEIEVAPPRGRQTEVRTTKAPAIPQVEAKPVKEEIEPLAQSIETPKVSAKPAMASRQAVAPTRPPVTVKKHEDVAPQQQQHASGRMKSQKQPIEKEVAAEEVVETRARSVDVQRHERASVRAEREVAAATDAIEWKGLSVEPERRSMGKVIIAVVAIVVVAGAIVGGILFNKSSRKANTAAAATAAPLTAATSVPAPAPAETPSAKTTSTNTSAKSAPTATTTNGASSQPSAPSKPAQPAIVIARGSGSNNSQQPDEAPPQLAFAGAQPTLPIGGTAAMPARPTSNAVPAQVIRKVSPTYPDIARRMRQRGNVELQAQILKDGTVGKVEVVSGPTLLRGAAIDAVKQWRYRPAYLGGGPAESTVKVVVSFDQAQ